MARDVQIDIYYNRKDDVSTVGWHFVVDTFRIGWISAWNKLTHPGKPRLDTLQLLSLFALAFSAATADARGATGETIYSFGKTANAGFTPLAGVLIDTNGDLFGTLSDDGTVNRNYAGVAYELRRQGGSWVQKKLHRFQPKQGDGGNPSGALIPDGTGALYGTTPNGGSYGRKSGGGIVFKLTPPNGSQGPWSESILYSFNGRSEGSATGGGLIFDNKGAIYLTHFAAGSGLAGAVSMLSPPAQGATAWTNSTIYTFQGGTDGGEPSGQPLVFDASGAIYGVTEYGGGGTICGSGFGGCGTVYKLTPPEQAGGPWTETILYAFTGGADGAVPNSNLVFDGKGNLFSTTTAGGANNFGTLFELSPPTNGQTTWTETVIHSFGYNNDFTYPQGNTIITNSGSLIVSARGGGPYNGGAIVQFKPPAGKGTWKEETLYSFTGDNGADPIGITLDASGNIYGTTVSDGGYHVGVAFKVHP